VQDPGEQAEAGRPSGAGRQKSRQVRQQAGDPENSRQVVNQQAENPGRQNPRWHLQQAEMQEQKRQEQHPGNQALPGDPGEQDRSAGETQNEPRTKAGGRQAGRHAEPETGSTAGEIQVKPEPRTAERRTSRQTTGR